MLKIRNTVVAAITGIALASPAVAADYTVTQKNKQFDKVELKVSAGDSIRFVNQDDHAHNVYSRSSGNTFDLGLQDPGTGESVVFSTPGSVNIRCAIHPKMKMTVMVSP